MAFDSAGLSADWGQDPVQIFNEARLHIHVPPSPLSTPPPCTSLKHSTLSAQELDAQELAIDNWVAQIAAAEEREDAFYGQSQQTRAACSCGEGRRTRQIGRAHV